MVLGIQKIGTLWDLEFGDFGDPRIPFWEGIIVLYKLFTKLVISGSKRPKLRNCEICSCLLVLARAQSVLVPAEPVLARAEPVLGPPKSSFGRAAFPFCFFSQNR